VQYLQRTIFSVTAKHLPLIPLPVVDLERPIGRRAHEARWVVTWGVEWVPAVAGSCVGDSAPSGSRFHCPLEVSLQVPDP